MQAALSKKITLNDLRRARTEGTKIPMLTCYDFTTARHMQEAGVPAILVGDSAANVVLGYDSTLPVSLDFMIEITRAVRKGAPLAFVVGDMPFGSYHESTAQAVRNVIRMVKETGCDAVKLEITRFQGRVIQAITDAGVAVIAHIGLRPQSVGLTGGYRFHGRTSEEAYDILASALLLEDQGAQAILLEAVPPEVAKAVVERVKVPIIGCGAGPACHSCVVVTHDALGLTPHRPRFVPTLIEMSQPLQEAFTAYVKNVMTGNYPTAEHDYVMPPAEKTKFLQRLAQGPSDEIPF